VLNLVNGARSQVKQTMSSFLKKATISLRQVAALAGQWILSGSRLRMAMKETLEVLKHLNTRPATLVERAIP
jgi:hypothetical protein